MSEMTEREMARAARTTMTLPDYGPARPMQVAGLGSYGIGEENIFGWWPLPEQSR